MNDEQVSVSSPGIIGKVKKTVTDGHKFLNEDLWDVNLNILPGTRRFLLSVLRVMHMVVKGFITNRSGVQASAMTYFTLMAMVPVLALMLSVSKGFRVQDRLLETVGIQFDTATREVVVAPGGALSELPQAMVKVIKDVFLAVENTNFSTLGIVGIALLFWSVVKMMGRIEAIFNIIWGVGKSRTIIRKFSDYISVLVTFPILLLLATSASAALRSEGLNTLLRARLGPLFWVYERGLGLSSVFFVVLGFSLLYMFMPNTKVKLLPAFIGGLIGGICFISWQWFYFTVQIGAAKQNPIYGTFAAIPLFLIFVQIGWLLVLFGAEVGFAVQNYKTYNIESSPNTMSFATQQLLGLLIITEVARAFHKGCQWNPVDYSSSHNIPARITAIVLDRLVDGNVLIAVEGDKKERSYVPAKDLGTLTVADVRAALSGAPLKNIRLTLEAACPSICERIDKLEKRIYDDLGDSTMAEVALAC